MKCFLRKQIIPLALTEGPIWELGEHMKPLVLTEGPIWELGEHMKPLVLTDRPKWALGEHGEPLALTDWPKGWTLGRKDCPKGRVEGGAGTKISVSGKKIVSL